MQAVDPVALEQAIANPSQASAGDILHLQRQYGNRAVSQLVAPATQPQPSTRSTIVHHSDVDGHEPEQVFVEDEVDVAEPTAPGSMTLAAMPPQPPSDGAGDAPSDSGAATPASSQRNWVQPKLVVGPARDPYEQEADRVAEQVLGLTSPASSPPIQREEEEDEVALKPLVQRQDEAEEPLQMKPRMQRASMEAGFELSSDVEGWLAAHKGGGGALPDDIRSHMESGFGSDFSGVRVHTDREAAALNEDLSAQAFTHGSDIYFAEGKYVPGTTQGQRLLAHELTHVVQQGSAPVKRQPALGAVVQRDSREELEYEENSIVRRSVGPNALTQPTGDLFVELLRGEQERSSLRRALATTRVTGGAVIQRDLTDRLNRALDRWGTDTAAIIRDIRAAPADQKQMVLRDPVLLRRLQRKLSRADGIRALTELGAPLAQRLELAMSGWGADSTAILNMIAAAPNDQKQAVLRNPSLMANLRSELSRADAIRALQGLGASLAERLYAAMQGWGADAAAVIRLARDATADEKRAALHDRALIARLKDELNRAQMLNVLEQLGASLADRLNTAMDGWGVDSATVLTLTRNATDAQRQEALGDSALLARLHSELSRADMATVLANLHASLADRLHLALGGWSADDAAILNMIPAAPEAERRAVLDDAALMASLRSRLNDATYWRARLLLRFGSQAVIDAPSAQVPAISNGVYYRTDVHIQAGERVEALSTMVSALETRAVLARASYREIVYDASGAGEGLTTVNGFNHDAAAGRWTITSLPRVTVHPVGFADVGWLYSTILHEYQHVQQFNAGYTENPNSAVVIDADEVQAYLWEIEHARDTGVINNPGQLHDVGNRLTNHFNALDAAHQATYQARYNAAIAVVNAVPLAPGAPAPAAAQSLTVLLSSEIERHPPDTAKMLRDITAASAADKELVRRNHNLMERLAATLSQADMRQALALLGVPMVERLNLLLSQNATAADMVALINSGTPADRQAVLDNAELVNRLLAYLSREDAGRVLEALGDTLSNRILRAASGDTVAEGPIFAMIRAATPAARSEAALNSTLLNTLRGVLSPYNFWRVRLLLEYGTEGGFPAGVTTMVAALRGTPTAASIRRTIVALSEADYAVVKDVVGIRDILRALVSDDDDYMLILRTLQQGLVDETTESGTYAETLLEPTPGAPALVFAPMVFNGTRGFDVAYYRDRVQVRVRIGLNPVDAQAGRDQAAQEALWEPMIEGAWDNKFSLQNANHTLPIRVSCSFTTSSPHHTVNIYSTPSTGWPAYNEFNWYYNDPAYAPTSPIHEFGHMLSNPDEYDLSAAAYTATVGTNPATDPNAVPQTDTAGVTRYSHSASVMGTGGPVQRRHLNYFTNWINVHRRTNPDGTFAEPAFTII